jgi:predicted nucleic acid-binding protein
MKFVVDTNVLMTYFWKNSQTRNILISNRDLELIAPEFALEEINKYKKEIIKKAKISEEEFNVSRIDLAIFVQFIPLLKYQNFLKNALEISPDSNDVDFIALALKLKCPLWSNDKKLKTQRVVEVYSTEDAFKLF